VSPDFMLVPISFFVDMHDWGMNLNYPSGGTISYDKRQIYYNYLGKRCRIIWSNKFLNLSEIIIGNSMNSLWRYRPDEYNGKRVTIRITPKGMDGVLLVKTDFEYHPPLSDEVSIISFPDNLTKIKEKPNE